MTTEKKVSGVEINKSLDHIEEGGRRIPSDYQDPKFSEAGKVHDWKNYAPDPLRATWESFTENQRAAIAEALQIIADAEEWD